MPFVVHCTCGKKLSAKDEQRGKRVKCPACGQVLTVPEKAGAGEAVTADLPVTKHDAPKWTPAKPGEDEWAGGSYGVTADDSPRQQASKSRADRIEASVRKRKKRKLTLWDKALRFIGLKPKPMMYKVRVGSSELTLNARMLAEQLKKGELHLGTEVRLIDSKTSEDDRDWTTIEDGPSRKEFFVRRMYDPVGAFGAHGAQLGMVYFSIFMWIVAPLVVCTGAAIAEHGWAGLLIGPLTAVLVVGLTLLVVGVSLWLISREEPALIFVVYLFFGCTPLIVVLWFLVTQLIYMGIGFVLGWVTGAIIGAVRKGEFSPPGT